MTRSNNKGDLEKLLEIGVMGLQKELDLQDESILFESVQGKNRTM